MLRVFLQLTNFSETHKNSYSTYESYCITVQVFDTMAMSSLLRTRESRMEATGPNEMRFAVDWLFRNVFPASRKRPGPTTFFSTIILLSSTAESFLAIAAYSVGEKSSIVDGFVGDSRTRQAAKRSFHMIFQGFSNRRIKRVAVSKRNSFVFDFRFVRQYY